MVVKSGKNIFLDQKACWLLVAVVGYGALNVAFSNSGIDCRYSQLRGGQYNNVIKNIK